MSTSRLFGEERISWRARASSRLLQLASSQSRAFGRFPLTQWLLEEAQQWAAITEACITARTEAEPIADTPIVDTAICVLDSGSEPPPLAPPLLAHTVITADQRAAIIHILRATDRLESD
jgi:hypothetical protein